MESKDNPDEERVFLQSYEQQLMVSCCYTGMRISTSLIAFLKL